jgi:uncharacterized membrane protein
MAEKSTARLEAFCDGVFAIALTLLVMDIKAPPPGTYDSNETLWRALQQLYPTLFAFLLSFIVILITWVNHHNALKLVRKTSSHFIYANGFLLLTIVVIPFPTALLGENILTSHAVPAVVLYSSVFAFQAVAWNLMSRAALNPKNPLYMESAEKLTRDNQRNSVFAFIFYTLCAVLAFWFPQVIAVIVAATWIGWLLLGINLKTE